MGLDGLSAELGALVQRYIKLTDRSPRAAARLFIYYLQRTITSRTLRRLGTFLALCVLPYLHTSGKRVRTRSDGTNAFAKRGYLLLGSALNMEQCGEIHRYLLGKRLIDTRGGAGIYDFSDRPVGTKLGDYTLDTVVHCPHVMELANRTDFLNLAAEYLGFTPTISNLSLRWSFPTQCPAGEVQTFHRDSEATSFKILVYLTDVDLTAGPHIYVVGSHRDRMPLRLRLYSDEEIARDYGERVVVTGRAGTAFAIDTRGIHKGAPPTDQPRLVLGIQYALLPCFLYEYMPVPRDTDRKFDEYVNRLIIRARRTEPDLPQL